jgi:hypothetical protein
MGYVSDKYPLIPRYPTQVRQVLGVSVQHSLYVCAAQY